MNNALQTATQAAKVEDIVPSPDSNGILAVIERAAVDPNVDVDKMERLLAMHERIVGKQAEAEFISAMTEAQIEMRPVAADADNPQTRSRYASYHALDKALRPIYTSHGLVLSFDTGEGAPAECIRVLCYVSHRSGHSRTYHVDMPADGKGAKGGDVMTKTHAAGAGMTYGMRYLLKLIFNVAIGEDETDGNMPIERITEEQALTIDAKIKDNGISMAGFLKWLSGPPIKAKSIDDIGVHVYDFVIKTLDDKIAAKAKK